MLSWGSKPEDLMQASGQPEQTAAPTFFDIISGDEDTTMRSIVQITNGVTGIVDKVQTLLVYWEKKYKHMWDQDKDAYIRCGYTHGLAGFTRGCLSRCNNQFVPSSKQFSKTSKIDSSASQCCFALYMFGNHANAAVS